MNWMFGSWTDTINKHLSSSIRFHVKTNVDHIKCKISISCISNLNPFNLRLFACKKLLKIDQVFYYLTKSSFCFIYKENINDSLKVKHFYFLYTLWYDIYLYFFCLKYIFIYNVCEMECKTKEVVFMAYPSGHISRVVF